jgi:hypothetical protein
MLMPPIAVKTLLGAAGAALPSKPNNFVSRLILLFLYPNSYGA